MKLRDKMNVLLFLVDIILILVSIFIVEAIVIKVSLIVLSGVHFTYFIICLGKKIKEVNKRVKEIRLEDED